MKLALQIAAGIFLGLLVWQAFTAVMARVAIDSALEEFGNTLTAVTESENRRREAKAAQEREQAATAKAIADAAQRKEKLDSFLREERAELEAERLQAFESQYVSPKGCDMPRDETHLFECNNHKLRAKKQYFAENTISVSSQ